MLIFLLHEDAVQLNIQVHMVTENKPTHQQQLKCRKVQSAICKIWKDYTNGTKSAIQVLKSFLILYMFLADVNVMSFK